VDLTLRPVLDDDELLAFQRAVAAGFHRVDTEERVDDLLRAHQDRTVVALDREDIVGTGINFALELVVPGGRHLAMAGVSAISTRSTHTRRGVLRAVMQALTEDARARGEPLLGLTASEGPIYRRFGFGVATMATAFEVERRLTSLHRPSRAGGRLRIVDDAAARAVLPAAYAEVMDAWPGAVSRPDAWWSGHYFDDPHDTDKYFHAVHEDSIGHVDGYTTYTVSHDWPAGVARASATAVEIVASDPEVRLALWEHLLRLDLVDRVKVLFLAPDEPLLHLLTDARRMRIVEHRDRLWLRLLDVAGCLSARSYRGDGELCIDVVDGSGHAAGRFLLEVVGGAGACEPAPDRACDLRLDVADLGAAYLGGVRWVTLARAGLVEECTAGSVAAADALFAVDPLPTTVTWF
jgi:predicted acetyltransferase